MKKENKNKVEEPATGYSKRTIRVFNSFEEQHQYELEQMAQLTPLELLLQLRKQINIAYGMHGFNPDKLPTQHTIKTVKGER